MDEISVAICDDSALMRNLIGRIVEATEGLSICFKAQNGQDLLDKLQTSTPDVILLDIEMPVMTGVEFLKERKARNINIPVVIISSIATEGAAVTMQCLSLGASDFVTKPGGSSVSLKIADVSREIIECIASYGGRYARRHGKEVYEPDFFDHQIKLKEAERFVQEKKASELQNNHGTSSLLNKASAVENAEKNKTTSIASMWRPPKPKEKTDIVPLREGGKIEIIAIGISTGGPNALRDVFKAIDANLKQPILVVQHMPAGFTKEFAASLHSICPLPVTEAEDGELIRGGHIYIAPGNKHILVEHRPMGNLIRLSDSEQRNGHRPSADVLFESVAKVYQNHALGVIMTGMGRDGASELAEMRKQGAWTLGQDQESSIVYGMPRVAWELGGVQKQVALQDMAAEISSLAKEHLYE